MDQAAIVPTTIATINSERFITSPLWQFAACEWSRRILHGRRAGAKKDRNAGCAIGAAEILLQVALEVARRKNRRACDRAARVSTLLTGASRRGRTKASAPTQTYWIRVPPFPPLVSSSGAITTAAATRSPGSICNRRTPWALRPDSRIVVESMRMILP